MAKSETAKLPRFKSLDELVEFFDENDLGDYLDEMPEAHFEVDLQRRVFLTALEPELARKLGEYARKRGISSQTLINLWLSEKLAEVQAKRDKVAE
jgi:hypothetical protein